MTDVGFFLLAICISDPVHPKGVGVGYIVRGSPQISHILPHQTGKTSLFLFKIAFHVVALRFILNNFRSRAETEPQYVSLITFEHLICWKINIQWSLKTSDGCLATPTFALNPQTLLTIWMKKTDNHSATKKCFKPIYQILPKFLIQTKMLWIVRQFWKYAYFLSYRELDVQVDTTLTPDQ